MRPLFALALVALVVAPAPSASARPEARPSKVHWHVGAFDALLARAKAESKPLMVDVYATWCGPCQALDRKVYTRADVGAEAAHWFAVKVNAEAGDGPKVLKRYHVVGYPTVLFLDPSGKEIDRIFGYEPPAEFLRTMRDYREGKGTLAVLAKEALAHPLDLDLAEQVGERYAIRGNAVAAKRAFARIFAVARLLAADPRAAVRGAADVSRLGGPGDFPEVRKDTVADFTTATRHVDALLAKAYLVLGKYLYLRGEKDYPAAVRVLTELRRRFPDSPEAAQVPYELAVAWWKQGKADRAKAALTRFLTAGHESTDAVNTVAWFCFEERAFMPWGEGLAKAALAKDPKAAGLWDTLAELENATGDPKSAVAAEQAAIRADPKDPYYRDQLDRFTAASKRGSPESSTGTTGG